MKTLTDVFVPQSEPVTPVTLMKDALVVVPVLAVELVGKILGGKRQ